MRICSSAGSVTVAPLLASSATPFLLFQFLQNGVQLIEPSRPEALVTLHPVVDRPERLGVEPVQPPPSLPTHLHHPHLPEHPKMLGHQRLAHPEHPHHFVHRALTCGEEFKDLAPAGLGHRVESVRRGRRSCHEGIIYNYIVMCQISGSRNLRSCFAGRTLRLRSDRPFAWGSWRRVRGEGRSHPGALLVLRMAASRRWPGPSPLRLARVLSRVSGRVRPGRAASGRRRRRECPVRGTGARATSLSLDGRPRRRSPFPFARTREVKEGDLLPSSPAGLRSRPRPPRTLPVLALPGTQQRASACRSCTARPGDLRRCRRFCWRCAVRRFPLRRRRTRWPRRCPRSRGAGRSCRRVRCLLPRRPSPSRPRPCYSRAFRKLRSRRCSQPWRYAPPRPARPRARPSPACEAS